MSIKDDNFYNASKALTQFILQKLAQSIETSPRIIIKNQWEKQEARSYSRYPIRSYDWIVIYYQLMEQLKNTKEYKAFMKAALTNEVISKHCNNLVGTPTSSMRQELTNIPYHLLSPFF